jgi:hypothetical protein
LGNRVGQRVDYQKKAKELPKGLYIVNGLKMLVHAIVTLVPTVVIISPPKLGGVRGGLNKGIYHHTERFYHFFALASLRQVPASSPNSCVEKKDF